jgi:PAS domain S-box-containing protein
MDVTALGQESRLDLNRMTASPILEALPVGVWVAGADGKIAFSNKAARRLWGGEMRVPLEQYDRFKAWWPDGRRIASPDWGLHRAFCTREVVTDEEVNIETFDGRQKVIRNSAAPITDDSGCVIGAVAVNEDITSLKGAEAARDLFAGVLGHDLRSPLHAITMSMSLLGMGRLEPGQQRALARIQSGTTRIQQLVDTLLDFTRARFGLGFPVDPAPMDMGEACARVVDEVRTAHSERRIELQRHGDLRGVWDPARVSQVASNLIGNAVQHGQDPIVVGADDAGDAVTVSVSNRGAPIEPRKAVSLFEPFRRGDGSKGIGLGLFIAREILRSHGGSIEVASTDRATTFMTRWPRVVR